MGQADFARKKILDVVAVIDFETTGLSPNEGARATEVAAVILKDLPICPKRGGHTEHWPMRKWRRICCCIWKRSCVRGLTCPRYRTNCYVIFRANRKPNWNSVLNGTSRGDSLSQGRP